MGTNNAFVAAILPEIAFRQIPTYTGGLGYLWGEGGAAASAYNMQLPLVIVTLLYKEGYYHQIVSDDRMQVGKTRMTQEEIFGIFEDTGLIFPITICGAQVKVKVWRLPPERFNTIPVYFLDTDIDENDYLSRLNTLQLYGGWVSELGFDAAESRKIAQMLVLGKGSIEALRRLDIPVTLYHLNEAHTAFVALQLLEENLQKGMEYEDAVRDTRNRMVFTTHTPVADGNPRFDILKVIQFGNFSQNGVLIRDLLYRLGGDPFNMAAACLHLSQKANAVSQKHLTICRKIWGDLENLPPLIGITNGVNKNFWQIENFRDAKSWRDMQVAKCEHKRQLLGYIEKHCGGKRFSDSIFTLVWARRFARYKRPKLLFYDEQWIETQLRANRIQIIISGKPHPDDKEMIDAYDFLLRRSRELPNMAVLTEYNMEQSRILKAGADAWLNTPRAPFEASGTSGMSAALNGALNISTPDGWMVEAIPDNCRLFGSYFSRGTFDYHDVSDAEDLRRVLEETSEQFYSAKEEWYKTVYAAKLEAEERWTSDRMIKEYVNELYRLK